MNRNTYCMIHSKSLQYQFWRFGGVCLQNKRWHTSDELRGISATIHYIMSTYQIHKYRRTPQRHKFCIVLPGCYRGCFLHDCQGSNAESITSPSFVVGPSLQTRQVANGDFHTCSAASEIPSSYGIVGTGNSFVSERRYQISEQVRAHSR